MNYRRKSVQPECVDRIADGDQHVLQPVDEVRFRRVRNPAYARVPQRVAGVRVERNKVSARVACEEDAASRREDSAGAATAGDSRELVPPGGLPGLVVDRR